MENKDCARCKKSYPFSHFKDGRYSKGYRTFCKTCQNEKAKVRQNVSPDRKKAVTASRQAKTQKAKADSHKLLVQAKAKEELWHRGKIVEAVLDSNQMEISEAFEASDSVSFVVLCSRRIGKSVFCITKAIEKCLKKPGYRVMYLSTTSEQTKQIVEQSMAIPLQSCPTSLKPRINHHDNKVKFRNGSEIRFKGLDKTGRDSIRGSGADLIIADEFCFMKEIGDTIADVLNPMLMESEGRLILASTPPDSPGHDSVQLIRNAELKGNIIKRTIYDCPRWSQKKIETFIEEAGGEHTTTFQREYMCAVIVERSRAILPSFTEDNKLAIVQEPEQPKYIPDYYVSLDPGWRDKTALLFGYWDYTNAKLVILDEHLDGQLDTGEIAKVVKEKEAKHFKQAPYRRISDTEPRLLQDLSRFHDLHFMKTAKDGKEARINALNIMIERHEIVIHPRCKELILQMNLGIWNKTRSGFERSKAFGHSDLIDALIYMSRNISKNNLPEGLRQTTPQIHPDWYRHKPQLSHNASAIRSIFKRRR